MFFILILTLVLNLQHDHLRPAEIFSISILVVPNPTKTRGTRRKANIEGRTIKKVLIFKITSRFLSKLAWDPEADVRRQILLQFGDLAGFLIQSNPEIGYAYVLATLVPVFPTLLLDPVFKETRQDAAEALLVLLFFF